MSVQNDFPVLDGIAPSWADVIIKASPAGGALLDIKDISAVKRKRTVSVGELQGASGGRVMKRTTGTVKYELSLTLYQSGYQKLMRGLVPQAKTRSNQKIISLVHFGLQVQYTPFNDSEIYEWRAKGVRLIGDSHDAAEGDNANQVEVTCSVLAIVDMVDGAEIVFL